MIITFTTDDEGTNDTTNSDTTDNKASTDTVEVKDNSGAKVDQSQDHVFSSPSVRHRARELDVDISEVTGSDLNGRIVKQDVLSAAGETTSEASSEPVQNNNGERSSQQGRGELIDSIESSEDSPSKREKTLATPATRALAEELGVDIDEVPAPETRKGKPYVTEEAVQSYADQDDADSTDLSGTEDGSNSKVIESDSADRREPYRGVRRTIGKQMEQSKFTAPHVTHHDEVDVTDLVETRKKLREKANDQDIKLTYLPFVVKAVVAGLQNYPIVNAQLDEEAEEIVIKNDYNIGVATDTEAGLLVPVIQQADQKDLLQIASETNELVEKARSRELSRNEMQGGTFTITNIGAIGGEYATPIINHSESAILALGAIKEKPCAWWMGKFNPAT